MKHSIANRDGARAIKDALERTIRICDYFKFSCTMIQDVKDIFKSLVRSSKFLRKYFRSKVILGGVVILIVANRSELTIPKEKICERIGCYLAEFKSVLNMVIEENPSLKPTPKPMSDLIPHLVNGAKFDTTETNVIKERCKQLIELISESNMMNGKNPTHIIHAALCLTWKSIKPKERGINKITFRKFCSLCDLPFSETGNQRYKELIEFITTLVTYLPWNKLSINMIKVNLSFHLTDILNHSTMVLDRYNEANRPKVPIEIQETSNLMETYQPIVLPIEEPEISDSEIDKYIRSAGEVKFIKNLHRKTKL